MTGPTEGRFKDHFSDRAAAYAEHRPSYPVALVEFLAGLPSRPRVAWDCGCGSGQLSLLLATRFERVIATDASAQQIAAATRHPNVDYRCAPAEASGLPNGVVDLAVAAQAAHWFDLTLYYAEVRRVARPGAIVALVTYWLLSIDDTLDPVIRRFYSEVLGPYWPPERRHVETNYGSLLFPFDEIEAPPLEIRVDWALADVLGFVGTWSATRAITQARGPAPLAAFRGEMAQAWGPHGAVRTVRWPLALRVGRL